MNKTKVIQIALIAVSVLMFLVFLFPKLTPHRSAIDSGGQDDMPSAVTGQGENRPGTGKLLERAPEIGTIQKKNDGNSTGGYPDGIRGIESANRSNPVTIRQEDAVFPLLPPGMNMEDIPPEYSDDPEPFLDRLKEVREGENFGESDENAHPVFFSTILPDLETGLPYVSESFSPLSERVYAFFPSDSNPFNGNEEILAKWYNSDGEEILFEYMGITPWSPYNYVWMEEIQWDPGRYRVEIYELENDIGLLAFGEYTIQDTSSFIGHLGVYQTFEDTVPRSSFGGEDTICLMFNWAVDAPDSFYVNTVFTHTGQEIVGWTIVPETMGITGRFKGIIKDEETVLPPGTYLVEMRNQYDNLIGRSRFFIWE